MKHKKEKQVSVHSSIAAASGPKPEVKVKKHFENAWKDKKINSRSTTSKPADSLPCICEEQEEEILPQKSMLKTNQSDVKKKWTKSNKIQAQSSHSQKPAPAKTLKIKGEEKQKKHVEINVTIPPVLVDTSSSSNYTDQKTTNTPVTCSSELQLDAPFYINKENTQPDFDQIFNINTPYQSELDILYSDKPLHPILSGPPGEENISRTFLWNPSSVCEILNKPYEELLCEEARKKILTSEKSHRTKYFKDYNMYNCEIPIHDVASYLSSGSASVYHDGSVGQKSGNKLSEERTTQAHEIQLELLRWREKLKENQKKDQNGNKFNINSLSLKSYGRDKNFLQKTPISFEPLQEVQEEATSTGSDSSIGQRYLIS